MQTIWMDPKDVPEMFRRCFPEYRGTKFKVRGEETVTLSNGYWQGGSKSEYVGLDLATGQALPCIVAEPGNPFTSPGVPIVVLEPGKAVVEHHVFCGKDMGLTIHVHPDNLAKLLPAGPSIDREMAVVLEYTGGLKSSYGGIKDFRFHEAHRADGISREEWDAAKAECISRGLLNKAGAITPAGRNARSTNDYGVRAH